jgi:hypothetical protein
VRLGILRCAAFSAVSKRYPATEFGQITGFLNYLSRPLVTPADDPAQSDSCIQHFHDKLLNIRDRLKTGPGKRIGEARHQTVTISYAACRLRVDHC